MDMIEGEVSMRVSNKALHNQLCAYESWADAHDEAMEAWELDGWLRIGLSLLDLIRAADEHWSSRVRDGKAEWLGAELQEIRTLYREWLAPCEAVLSRIAEIDSRGYKVDDAKRFRDAYRRTRLLLSVDPTVLAEADESLAAGKGHSLGEVRDAIRGGHLRPGI
jgi:hypothetical protein